MPSGGGRAAPGGQRQSLGQCFCEEGDRPAEREHLRAPGRPHEIALLEDQEPGHLPRVLWCALPSWRILCSASMTDGPQGNIPDCILFQPGQQRPEILTGLEPEPALPRACNGVVDGAG